MGFLCVMSNCGVLSSVYSVSVYNMAQYAASAFLNIAHL